MKYGDQGNKRREVGCPDPAGGGVLPPPPRSGDIRESCDGLPELLTASNSSELAIAENSRRRRSSLEKYGWEWEDEKQYWMDKNEEDEKEPLRLKGGGGGKKESSEKKLEESRKKKDEDMKVEGFSTLDDIPVNDEIEMNPNWGSIEIPDLGEVGIDALGKASYEGWKETVGILRGDIPRNLMEIYSSRMMNIMDFNNKLTDHEKKVEILSCGNAIRYVVKTLEDRINRKEEMLTTFKKKYEALVNRTQAKERKEVWSQTEPEKKGKMQERWMQCNIIQEETGIQRKEKEKEHVPGEEYKKKMDEILNRISHIEEKMNIGETVSSRLRVNEQEEVSWSTVVKRRDKKRDQSGEKGRRPSRAMRANW